jgi:hypothetical protein
MALNFGLFALISLICSIACVNLAEKIDLLVFSKKILERKTEKWY